MFVVATRTKILFDPLVRQIRDEIQFSNFKLAVKHSCLYFGIRYLTFNFLNFARSINGVSDSKLDIKKDPCEPR